MNAWKNDNQLLCHCHGVKAGVVRRVVRELRAKDAREVGRACKAGTGCRSCVPDIEAVIDQEKAVRRSFLSRLLDRIFRRGGA